MKPPRTFPLLLAILYLSGICTVSGQRVESSVEGFSQPVNALIHTKMAEYRIPGLAIGVVQGDSVLYTQGCGVKKLGTEDSVRAHSVFHTASISKLFTAQAVMQLVAEQKIALDDKLPDLLPALQYSDERAKTITVKQLLNHTSGLPDIKSFHWKNNHQSGSSLRDYVLGLKLKLSSEPGAVYRYSNLGYDILGYLVETVSGQAFEDYVKANILDPSGMAHSDFRYFLVPDSLRVSPHAMRKLGRKVYPGKTYPYTREHAPSSTLNASAEDLSRWMLHFLGKLKDAETAKEYRAMLEPSTPVSPNIGLGFQLYDIEGHRAVGHFGGDQGFRSFLVMIPSEHIGVVVLGNCDYHEDFRQEIALPVLRLLLEEE